MNSVTHVQLLAVIKLQSYFRGAIARKYLAWMKSTVQTRFRIAQEIYDTEVTYYNNLMIVKDKFSIPLEQDANGPCKLITKDEHRLLFSQFPLFIGFSKQLQTLIKPRIDSWEISSSIGDIFVQVASFFKGYSIYFNRYESCLEIISKLRKNARFVSFIKGNENMDGRFIQLEQYFILPVQRITRYKLLIKVLLDNTWKSHRDYDSLEQALKFIIQTNDQINEMKRNRENTDKLVQFYSVLNVEKRFSLDKRIFINFNRNRRFICEGLLTEFISKGQPEMYYTVLFNDLIFWTKRKKNSLYLKHFDELQDATIEIMSTTVSLEEVHMIYLTTPNRYLGFTSSTIQETIKWYNDIRSCIGMSDTAIEPEPDSSFDHVCERLDIKQMMLFDEEKRDDTVSYESFECHARKPRLMRSRLKLTEMRFLEQVERDKHILLHDESKMIHDWQDEEDLHELSCFEISKQEQERIWYIFPLKTFENHYRMKQIMNEMAFVEEGPNILLLGMKGDGKTRIVQALLDISLPMEDLKRPIYIHVKNNPAYKETPYLSIHYIHDNDDQSTTITIKNRFEVEYELRRAASRTYTDVPVHLCYEHARFLDFTLIDTPGLDAFQFYNEHERISEGSCSVRTLVYDLAKDAQNQLLFVEECKDKNLMSVLSSLASVVDLNLSRSFFLFTKFYHKLRQTTDAVQLDSYLHLTPENVPGFFFTLPCKSTVYQTENLSFGREQILSQAFARDLRLLEQIGFYTDRTTNLGFHKFKKFFFKWLQTRFTKIAPKLLTQFENLARQHYQQTIQIQKQLDQLDIEYLRQTIRYLTYNFTHLISLILNGKTTVDHQHYGQLLHEEDFDFIRLYFTSWINLDHQPIIVDEPILNEKLPSKEIKLYGNPQILRLVQLFRIVVHQLLEEHRIDVLDVLNAALIYLDQSEYLSDNLAFVHRICFRNAQQLLNPLVKQLCKRVCYILGRLGKIAQDVILLDESKMNGKRKMTRLFMHFLSLYEHHIVQLSEICIFNCIEVLQEPGLYDLSPYCSFLNQNDHVDKHQVMYELFHQIFVDLVNQFSDKIVSKLMDNIMSWGMKGVFDNINREMLELDEEQIEQLLEIGPLKATLRSDLDQIDLQRAKYQKLKVDFFQILKEFQHDHHGDISSSLGSEVPLIYKYNPQVYDELIKEE